MRPIADTAVASIVNMPAADCSSWPQWIVCQSVAQPSSAEYWHIGETTMRFASVSPRNEKFENRDNAMAFVTSERGAITVPEIIGRADVGVTQQFRLPSL